MPIIFRRAWELPESSVTPESYFKQRRRVLGGIASMGLLSLSPAVSAFWQSSKEKPPLATQPQALNFTPNNAFQDNPITPESKATSHNNFYEFGLDKSDPKRNSHRFAASPWQLQIDGEVESPLTLDVDALIREQALEQRIYRLRCVEAWSMVIPWLGFPLSSLLNKVKALSSARYVAFETLFDPARMPGQRDRRLGGGIDFPYVEGLRMDEAMHPLTFIAVGMYGKTLPAQNGAPLRLVVPWKYGFKSIKSIVRISLRETQPPTTWNRLAPQEYGFYANVNPLVDHPRWSQGSERRIDSDSGLFRPKRIDTQLYNGYGDEVAALYKNMDLFKDY